VLFNQEKYRADVTHLAHVERHFVGVKVPTIDHVDHFAGAGKMVL
jgi:hypothetical protein